MQRGYILDLERDEKIVGSYQRINNGKFYVRLPEDTYTMTEVELVNTVNRRSYHLEENEGATNL